MKSRSAASLMTACAVLSQPLFGAATSVIVFGDSLSDTGNVQNATGGTQPNSDYSDGRFSNGPVWIEYEATRHGWASSDLLPWTEGGRNFAYGGGQTGTGLSHLGTPNVGAQIDLFKSLSTPLTADDMVVVWAGGNDLIFGDLSDPGGFIAGMANNMAGNITSLIGEGATNFYIPNLPDLSRTPLGASTANPAGLQALVMNYNMALEGTLQGIEAANSGVSIRRLDTYGILNDLMDNPGDYGFTDVTTPAYSGVSSGPPGQPLSGDPDTSVWWDSIHPTTNAHFYIPEPSTAWLLVASGLVALRRRRS